MNTPRIAVVVLNWNNPGDTLECLESLGRLSYTNVERVVVDNGSMDDSCRLIREAFPGITLIENARNLGFAAGNNIGLRHALDAGADFILMLNNDTTVHPRLVDELVSAHRSLEKPGMLTARIYYHDDPTRIWMGRPHWDADAGRFRHEQLNEIDETPGEGSPIAVDYACGCAAFFARDFADDVGLMDERYFCYFEEVDWCYRGRSRGYRHYEVPMARVWHKVSRASGGRLSPMVRYFRTRNVLLWARSHLARAERRRVFGNTWRECRQALAWKEQGLYWTLKRIQWSLGLLLRDPGVRAWRLGVRDYLLRRFGDCPAVVRRDRLETDVFASPEAWDGHWDYS